MKDAWKILKRAEQLAEDDPQLYAVKMLFLRTAGDSIEDRRKLEDAFEAGVALDPRAYGLHFERIESLLPRWGGDIGEWIRHSRSFGRRHFSEAEAKSYFARMVMYVAFSYAREEVQFNDTNPLVPKISWEELDAGFQALTNLFPRSPFFPSGYAVLAFRASEPDTGSAVASYLGDRFNPGHVDNRWVPHAWRGYDRVKKNAPHIPRIGTLYQPPVAMVNDIAFSPDSKRLAAAYRDGRVIVWKVNEQEPGIELDGSPSEALTVAFSPDGKLLASAIGDLTYRRPANKTLLRIHDAQTWELKKSVGAADFSARMTFSPDGKQIGVAGSDFHGRTTYFGLYSVAEASIGTHQWDEIVAGITATAYQPRFKAFANAIGTGMQLFVGSTNILYGFMAQSDTNTYECVEPVRDFAFFGDGSRVVIGQGRDWSNRHEAGQLSVWETRDWTNSVRVAQRRTPTIAGVSATPDGKWLFSGGVDQAVTMWDSKDLVTRAVLLGHSHGISRVLVSPDGRTLASASYDGRVILWDISQLDGI